MMVCPFRLIEWLQHVLSNPEMRADGYAEASISDDSTLRLYESSLTVWTAYSGHEININMHGSVNLKIE